MVLILSLGLGFVRISCVFLLLILIACGLECFGFALIFDVGLDFEFLLCAMGLVLLVWFCLVALLLDLLVVCVSCFPLFGFWVCCTL